MRDIFYEFHVTADIFFHTDIDPKDEGKESSVNLEKKELETSLKMTMDHVIYTIEGVEYSQQRGVNIYANMTLRGCLFTQEYEKHCVEKVIKDNLYISLGNKKAVPLRIHEIKTSMEFIDVTCLGKR